MPSMDRQRSIFRVNFRGLNTQLTPDAMPAGKYPAAVNVRADGDSIVKTRPGYEEVFATGSFPATDLRAYTTLGTDNFPRIIVHDSGGGVWLDDGVRKGVVGSGGTGASLIPYRPSQSPQPWMYIGNATGYEKFSAPDVNDAVAAYKVGIQEPKFPPNVAPLPLNFNDFTSVAASWSNAGTSGAAGNATLTQTVGVALLDTASNSRYSVEMPILSTLYQLGRTITLPKLPSGSYVTIIEDIIPAIYATNLLVDSIYYYPGITGLCIIVPTQMPSSLSVPTFTDNAPSAQSIYTDSALGSLRRGAIVSIGGEKCFVQSVTTGPNGGICFEVFTASVHAAGEAIVGVNAIVVSSIDATVAGLSSTVATIASAITVGTATLSQALGSSPFSAAMGPSLNTPQSADYLIFSVQISDLKLLTSGTLILDVNAGGAADYVTNAFYYQFTPATLLNTVITTDTVYPTSRWFTLAIPISDLTRLGTDFTKTLTNCQGVQFKIIATGSINFAFGSLAPAGGGQPDVGPNGSPYFYLVRGRDTRTGAVSNPSPITRYGVSPRRQPVLLRVIDGVRDPQMDTWDVYRYGGSVTSFRYIGSMANSIGVGYDSFTDNFYDTAALAGSAVEYDNFQPWPTVDVPFVFESPGSLPGITGFIVVRGTVVELVYSSASPFTNPMPATILRWLPGTLVIVGGQSAYTLWTRPEQISLSSPPAAYYYAYQFQFVEDLGDFAPPVFTIPEPNVADQNLPYLWGPDANGVVFGCGDPLRPGALYSSKQYNLDSSPNNIYDLTSTSEPLLGGEVINGLALVASSKRWWEIQAAFSTAGRWLLVETPAGRGLGAPFAHCTDGKAIYFVAKDGIFAMTPGLPAVSLTDADIGNLFPSDGVPGANVMYGSETFYAPDYARAAQFRLSIANAMLRFHYPNSSGTMQVLAFDLSLTDEGKPRLAWSKDTMADSINVSYAVEQPSGTLSVYPGTAYPQLYFADRSGIVYTEQTLHNDDDAPIAALLATAEFDAGDVRTTKRWLDAMVDAIPASIVTVTPRSGGTATGAASAIAAAVVREQSIVPLGGPVKSYLGLALSWTDDFTLQALATQIMEWTAEFVAQPIAIRSWQSVPTSHGLRGYHSIRQILFAYTADEDVTLTITAQDGMSPDVVTLPATSGAYEKVLFVLTFNKGLLFTYEGSSDGAWAPVLQDCEIYVGEWARQGPYAIFKNLGGVEAV